MIFFKSNNKKFTTYEAIKIKIRFYFAVNLLLKFNFIKVKVSLLNLFYLIKIYFATEDQLI